MLRFVISERDPGVANWLECTGHRRGYVQLRWQRLSRDLLPEDGPRAEVVKVAELARAAAVLRAAEDHQPASTPSGSRRGRPPSPGGCSASAAGAHVRRSWPEN